MTVFSIKSNKALNSQAKTLNFYLNTLICYDFNLFLKITNGQPMLCMESLRGTKILP